MTTPTYAAERSRTLPWGEKMPEDLAPSDARHAFVHAEKPIHEEPEKPAAKTPYVESKKVASAPDEESKTDSEPKA